MQKQEKLSTPEPKEEKIPIFKISQTPYRREGAWDLKLN